MAINPKTQVSASSILTIETYEKIKDLAKKNKRSVSSQIAFMLEQVLEKEGMQNEVERTGDQ